MSGRIVFTCGGTGGHIYPLIAVAQEYDPRQVLFIGSEDREDRHIIPRYGFSFHSISVKAGKRWSFIQGVWESFRYLKKVQPPCVVSSGGYLTVSVLVAAVLLRIPILILEQNTIPGRVNRLMSSFAVMTFLSFESSRKWIRSRRVRVVGNPVRKVYHDDEFTTMLRAFKPGNGATWVVIGGSQGASALNHLFLNEFNHFLNHQDRVILVTGPAFFKDHFKRRDYQIIHDQDGIPKVFIFPYIERMDLLYRLADIVVSRSGATTLAELMAFNKKAVLIPYPYAKDDHQKDNAEAFCSHYEGSWIEEDELTFTLLKEHVSDLLKRQQGKPQSLEARVAIKHFLDHILSKRS